MSKKSVKPKPLLRSETIFSELITGEENKAVYQKSKGLKTEKIGFFLRFIHEHFYPCTDCMEKLATLFINADMDLNKDTSGVSLIRENLKYAFNLHFLRDKQEYNAPLQFTPCTDCAKELHYLIVDAASITIGNKDYVYPVELEKSFDIDDKAWVAVDTHLATDAEKKRLKNSWFE